jgi:hypothetical protein
MTLVRVKSLLVRFLSSANAACIVAVVLFQSVGPLSKTGQFLFWPQNFLPFLHLRPNDPAGARISFLALTAVLTGCALVILSLFTEEMRIEAFSGATPGLLSVTGPLIGGILVLPLGRIATILMVIQTSCLAMYVGYCWGTRRRPKTRENVLMGLLFGWWAYLYESHSDPLFFALPFFGCCSYLAWAFWSTESWPGQREAIASQKPSR